MEELERELRAEQKWKTALARRKWHAEMEQKSNNKGRIRNPFLSSILSFLSNPLPVMVGVGLSIVLTDLIEKVVTKRS